MAGLAGLLQDIADKIIANDWFERESPDGSRSYYVIGADSYYDDMRSFSSYTTCFVNPRPKTGPLAEHVVRSQVAGSQREEYLKRERKRLEQAGVSAAAFERFIDGDVDKPPRFPKSVSNEERVDLFLRFLEARRVSRGDTTLDREEEQEVATVREKLCLQEVAKKYGKIVAKWEQLEPLPLADPQLEEASKAYLYGFYRSSVVLSASALETHLKRGLADDEERTYSKLVDDAADRRGMNRDWIVQAMAVFKFRNKVVHEGRNPTHDEAGEVLSNCRSVLTRLLSA